MKYAIMIATSNKEDLFDIFSKIWRSPVDKIFEDITTNDVAIASLKDGYHGSVSEHVRKCILRKKSKGCTVVYSNSKGFEDLFMIKAAFVKKHFDDLASYVNAVDEGYGLYYISKENAYKFIEDTLVEDASSGYFAINPTTVTAMHDRFNVINPETGAGHKRNCIMLVSHNPMSDEKLSKLHNDIKEVNKFRPSHRAEITECSVDYNRILSTFSYNNFKVLKCTDEKIREFDNLVELMEYSKESFDDFSKLMRRSVYFCV